MTPREHITALFELQATDLDITRLEHDLAGLDKGEEQAAKAEALALEHAAGKERLHSLDRDLIDSELQMKTCEQKKRDYEEKMYGGMVRNPKELEDMQREVEMLARQADSLEDKVLTLMEEVEVQRSLVAQQENVSAEAQAEAQSVRSEYAASSERLRGELAAARDSRRQRALAVQPDMLQRYEDLRAKKGGLAIVKVESPLCGGCRVSLPADLVRFLKKQDRIFTCESCGRILLWGGPTDS